MAKLEEGFVGLSMSITFKMAGGDLVKSSNGRLLDVRGLEKSAQDIAETYLTNFDPADPPWHPTGSEFYMIDENVYAYNQMGVSSMIRQMADSSLRRLMDVQQDDPEVDDEEYIEEILSINVWQIGDLSWAFYSICQTDSDEKVETGFDIDLSQQLPAGIDAVGSAVPGVGTPL